MALLPLGSLPAQLAQRPPSAGLCGLRGVSSIPSCESVTLPAVHLSVQRHVQSTGRLTLGGQGPFAHQQGEKAVVKEPFQVQQKAALDRASLFVALGTH